MMNRDEFEHIMNEAANDFGWWFTPMDDSWELWNEIVTKPDDYPEPVVDALLNMDTEDRLIWRTELAEKGYEMTPNTISNAGYFMQRYNESVTECKKDKQKLNDDSGYGIYGDQF